jgi:hypothetical protein
MGGQHSSGNPFYQRAAKERCCKNDGMSGQFLTVLARDLELSGAVRMKIVSYWRRRSGRGYDQRGFESKKEIPGEIPPRVGAFVVPAYGFPLP